MRILLKEFWNKIFLVSRGYSAPMSVLNWLVAFVIIFKTFENPNLLYGLIALIGIFFAHLGTNVFDDIVDDFLKVPKQEVKKKAFNAMSKKMVYSLAIFYFFIALAVGLFFFLNFGMPIVYLSLIASVFIILYPKLNNFALGELAVGLCFGVLLFAGTGFIMTSIFDKNLILISLPVSLLTVAVLYTHSLMDFDFDKKSGKFNLCQLCGSKTKALYGLAFIYALAFLLTIYFIYQQIVPPQTIIEFIVIPFIIKLIKELKIFNLAEDVNKKDFLKIFNRSRNISLYYNLILIFVFLIWGAKGL